MRLSALVLLLSFWSLPTVAATPFPIDAHTVALWHMDEASGSTIADSTGNNPGQGTGSIAPGRFGNGRQFQGSGGGDFITIPSTSSLANLSTMSVEAWVFPTSFDLRQYNGEEALVQKGDSTAPSNLYELSMIRNGGAGGAAESFTSFTINFTLVSNSGTAQAISTISHSPNAWYYIAGTYDGTYARIYVNGVLETVSAAGTGFSVNNADPLFINNHTFFSHSGSSNGRIGGVFDEVRISNVARTDAEIAAIMASVPMPPVAVFSWSPQIAILGQTVAFTDASSNVPTTWQWQFGDGATSASQNPTHIFANTGTYTVTLVVSNAAGSSTTTQILAVHSTAVAPVASFIVAPPGPLGGIVNFQDTSSGWPISWRWDFGDGASSTDQSPQHIYSSGTFVVRLTVTNSVGSSTFSKKVTISTFATLTANFTSSPDPAVGGAPEQFTDTSSGGPTTWLWNFGDGQTSTLQNPTHTYPLMSSVATYAVTLTIGNPSPRPLSKTIVVQPPQVTSYQVTGKVMIGTTATPRAAAGRTVTIQGKEFGPVTHAIADDGSFAFNVPTGSYSLSASIAYPDSIVAKLGSSGTRGGRTATISNIAVNVNAANVTRNIDFDWPVLFVHGIISGPERWKDWADGLAYSQTATMVFATTYTDTAAYDVESGQASQELRTVLDQVMVGLPRMRVIAHSKGGLVTRMMIGDNADISDAVQDVIELGTPNNGTTCYTSFVSSAVANLYHLTSADVDLGILNIERYDDIVRNRVRRPVHIIAGTASALDNVIVRIFEQACPSSCEANDGLVNASSAFLLESSTDAIVAPGFSVPYMHDQLGDRPTHWILDDIIIPYYRGRPFAPSCGNINTSICDSNNCIAGRGLSVMLNSGSASFNCNVSQHSVSNYVTLSWNLPTCALCEPAGLTAESGYGSPNCIASQRDPQSPIYLGVAIYRSTSADLTSMQRVGFANMPDTNFLDFAGGSFDFYSIRTVHLDGSEGPYSEIVRAR